MNVLATILSAFVGWILLVTIWVFPFMWLWNYAMPDVFGLPEVDFWHAAAIVVLSNIMFGNTSAANKGKE